MGQTPIKGKLKDFNYGNVELKPSHWEKQRQTAIESYLAIDTDKLLNPVRTLAGMPAPKTGLGGWYRATGGTFWQQISAYVRLYKETGDYRLAGRAMYLTDEWCKCADACEAVYENVRPYSLDKAVAGFLDMYLYLGYEKALHYISKMTDAAIKRFPTDIKRDGIQNHELSSRAMGEWYTMPEVFYRVYEVTGERKYFDFAKEWDYTFYWEKFKKKDYTFGGRHAYSHVNCLSSAARAYMATGDESYLEVMKTAYDEITTNHTYITGGYGPAESLFVDTGGYLANSINDPWEMKPEEILYTDFEGRKTGWSNSWAHCEVSCCSWAVFKFCNYLITLTGDARYGDWAEKILYNCLGSQPPITPDGKILYYAEYYRAGGLKSVVDRRMRPNGAIHNWQCCTGTFPQTMAEYANMLYYSDDNGIYISQYLPSKLSCNVKGAAVTINSYSEYPLEETVRLRIGVDRETGFALRLRVPSWAKGRNSITVNGREFNTAITPNQWAVIDRTWKEGDLVELKLPFSLEFVPIDKKYPNLAALRYGPIVLMGDEVALFSGDMNKPEEWIEPVEGELLMFRTKPGYLKPYDFTVETFRPYYSFPEMKYYYMYYWFNSIPAYEKSATPFHDGTV